MTDDREPRTGPEPRASAPPGSGADADRGLRRFRKIEELGRGGQGVVWLAEDVVLGRRVALKILDRTGGTTDDDRLRFRREAEVAARVEHPALCPVYDVGEEGGVAWIAMRYAEGGSLAARLGPHRRVPSTAAEVDAAAALIEKIARGLHAAHEAGVVHRDVKPANLLLTKEGEPLVADFGMARDLRTDSATLTERHHVVGTIPYMAPEQLAGDRGVDRQTDVWALGVTFYELIAGRRPFDGATLSAVAGAIERDAPPRLRTLNPAAPAEFDAVADVALEKERARRYRTALDFADDLARARRGEPVLARPAGPMRRGWRFVRRRPAVAGLGAVAAVALAAALALGGYLFARRDDLVAQDAARRAEDVERLVEEAFAELNHGDPAVAERAAAAALALAPQDDHAELAAAFVDAWGRRDPAGALARLRSYRSDDADAEDAFLRLEAYLRRRVAPGDAATAPQGEPRGPLSFFVEGSLRLDEAHVLPPELVAEKSREAVRHLRNAVQFATRPRRLYRYELAHALTHTHDRAERADAAAALVALWPDDPVARCWASALLLRVDARRAAEEARRAVAGGRATAFARRNLILALRMAGDVEAAAAEAASAAADAKSRNDVESLEEALRATVDSDPLEAAPAIRTAALEFARRRVDGAPHDVSARAALVRALLNAGELAEAEAEARLCVGRAPDDRFAREAMAEALNRLDRPAEAELHARRATDLAPQSYEAWLHLARALNRQGRFEEAVAALERRAAFAAHTPSAWFELGQARMRLERFVEAERAFAEAARLAPEDPQVLCNWGQALRRSGRARTALGPLRKGHAIGSARPNWRYDSARWVARAESDAKIEDVLRDAAENPGATDDDERFAPFWESAAELDAATRLAREGGLRAVEARVWRAVEREAPELLDADYRLRRARAAAAYALAADALDADAAAGAGTASRPVADAARAEALLLRTAAADRLVEAAAGRTELFAAARRGEVQHAFAAAMRAEALGWFAEPAFRAFRTPATRERLPAAVREKADRAFATVAAALAAAP